MGPSGAPSLGLVRPSSPAPLPHPARAATSPRDEFDLARASVPAPPRAATLPLPAGALFDVAPGAVARSEPLERAHPSNAASPSPSATSASAPAAAAIASHIRIDVDATRP